MAKELPAHVKEMLDKAGVTVEEAPVTESNQETEPGVIKTDQVGKLRADNVGGAG